MIVRSSSCRAATWLSAFRLSVDASPGLLTANSSPPALDATWLGLVRQLLDQV